MLDAPASVLGRTLTHRPLTRERLNGVLMVPLTGSSHPHMDRGVPDPHGGSRLSRPCLLTTDLKYDRVRRRGLIPHLWVAYFVLCGTHRS
jgi:hypothetical protein